MLKLEAMQLKMRGTQLSWKIADKFLNIHKRLEVVETIKMVLSLSLLSHDLSVSVEENPDRKKDKYYVISNYLIQVT